MFSKVPKTRFEATPRLNEVGVEIEKMRVKVLQLKARSKLEFPPDEATAKFIFLSAALTQCDQLIAEVNKTKPLQNLNETRYIAKILIKFHNIFFVDEKAAKILNTPKNSGKSIVNATASTAMVVGGTVAAVALTGGLMAIPAGFFAFVGSAHLSGAVIRNIGFDPVTDTAKIFLNILFAVERNLASCILVLEQNVFQLKDWRVEINEKVEDLSPYKMYFYQKEDNVCASFLDKSGHPMQFLLDSNLVKASTYLSTSYSVEIQQVNKAIMSYLFLIQYSALCDGLSLDNAASNEATNTPGNL